MDRSGRRAAAFTLIEILAVVAILGLVMTLVLPNVGAVRDRALRRQAQELAGQLELARQRAVVTGIPHRVLIDLEGGAYRLEWLAAEEAQADPGGAFEHDLLGAGPLPLAAPREAQLEFRPVPGRLGDFHALDSDLAFGAIETPEGSIRSGDSFVAFDRDGTASYTEIAIEDAAGRQVILDVLPLADAVRLRDAAL